MLILPSNYCVHLPLFSLLPPYLKVESNTGLSYNNGSVYYLLLIPFCSIQLILCTVVSDLFQMQITYVTSLLNTNQWHSTFHRMIELPGLFKWSVPTHFSNLISRYFTLCLQCFWHSDLLSVPTENIYASCYLCKEAPLPLYLVTKYGFPKESLGNENPTPNLIKPFIYFYGIL